MKLKNICIFLLVLLLAAHQSYAEEKLVVARVIDGDTIELSNDERVRLIGIDTPERGDCYYKEAKSRLEQLALGKEVILQKDITNRDKYNRLLRYIYLDDIFINDVLVKEGYAKAYYYKPDTKFYKAFRESEKDAKQNELGLWKYCRISIWKRIILYLLSTI